jgi:hypothetical protein
MNLKRDKECKFNPIIHVLLKFIPGSATLLPLLVQPAYINQEYPVSCVKRVVVYCCMPSGSAVRDCLLCNGIHKKLLFQTPVTYRDRYSPVEQTLIVVRPVSLQCIGKRTLGWFPWRSFGIHLLNLFHTLWCVSAIRTWLKDNAFEVNTLLALGLTLLKTAWFYSFTKDFAFFASAVHVGSELGEVTLVKCFSPCTSVCRHQYHYTTTPYLHFIHLP